MACLFFETGMPFKKENKMRMFKSIVFDFPFIL